MKSDQEKQFIKRLAKAFRQTLKMCRRHKLSKEAAMLEMAEVAKEIYMDCSFATEEEKISALNTIEGMQELIKNGMN